MRVNCSTLWSMPRRIESLAEGIKYVVLVGHGRLARGRVCEARQGGRGRGGRGTGGGRQSTPRVTPCGTLNRGNFFYETIHRSVAVLLTLDSQSTSHVLPTIHHPKLLSHYYQNEYCKRYSLYGVHTQRNSTPARTAAVCESGRRRRRRRGPILQTVVQVIQHILFCFHIFTAR